MTELQKWLNANKIEFKEIDPEVIEIEGLGKMFLADLSKVTSIFKGGEFNLMESPKVLMNEDIFHVVFPFGNNFYYYDLRGEVKFNILKYVGRREPTKLDIPFVNLGVHTPYELLSGSGSLSELVAKAKYLGHSAVGICDYNTLGATLNLQKECKAAGIKPIFGYSMVVDYLGECVEMKVYALSDRGLRNLLRIQKAVMVDSESHSIKLDTLAEYGEGCVLVVGKLGGEWLKANRNIIPLMKQTFESLYFQIDPTEYKAERIDSEVLGSMATFFENFADSFTHSFDVTPILICDSYYLDKADARNKIVLNKIATGAAHKQSEEQYFKDVDEHFAVLEPLFSDKWNVKQLFEQMCRATIDIADRCDAKYETDRNFMPRYDMTEAEQQRYGDRHTMFLSLLEDGFKRFVPEGSEELYRERLDKEIYVLESTDNVDYLLVQWDTVNWARQNDILVGCGRGSAGGSLVLYLLGITLIDPIKYDLLFERFLLPERAGLYPAQATKVLSDIESREYVEIEVENNRKIKLDKDAQILVTRGDEQLVVYADELMSGDNIIMDNRDYLWTINNSDNDATL